MTVIFLQNANVNPFKIQHWFAGCLVMTPSHVHTGAEESNLVVVLAKFTGTIIARNQSC